MPSCAFYGLYETTPLANLRLFSQLSGRHWLDLSQTILMNVFFLCTMFSVRRVITGKLCGTSYDMLTYTRRAIALILAAITALTSAMCVHLHSSPKGCETLLLIVTNSVEGRSYFFTCSHLRMLSILLDLDIFAP